MPSFAPVAQHHLFREENIPFGSYHWKSSIAGYSPAGKILTCHLPFLIFLLKLCLPLKTDTTSPKLENASLTAWSTAWSLMNSGRRMVTKIGSLPFLKGPTRLWKFRLISVSPKRHWISVSSSFSFAAFHPKNKINFEGETLYRASISVTPSDSRMRKISDSRIFLWVSSENIKWSSSDFSWTWAECDSSRDLCQTSPVRELFKSAEFGSRFSSGARTQSSSERRTKLNIPFLRLYADYLHQRSLLIADWVSDLFPLNCHQFQRH